jgi:hypothetical protein
VTPDGQVGPAGRRLIAGGSSETLTERV